MSQRFRRRPLEVEAMRVESEKWQEAFDWLESVGARAQMTLDTQIPEHDQLLIIDRDADTEVRAYTDDWLVKIGDRVAVLSESEFWNEFEAVDG